MQPPSSRDSHEPSTPTVILVGSSVRAAAMDTANSGARVIGMDRFGDLDLLANCRHWTQYDQQGRWLAEVDKLSPSVVVPVGGFEWPSDGDAKRLYRQHLVTYPDPAVLDRIHDPNCLSEVASRAGVAFPETRDRPPAANQNHIWLIKPRISGGGIGIRPATASPTTSRDHFFQRFVKGQVVGANFMATPRPTKPTVTAHFLGLYAGLTYRRNALHPFLYGGSYGPLWPCDRVMQQVRDLGQCIAAEFSLLGLFNVDLVLGSTGELTLLEINPRYSASMELIRQTSADSPPLIDWHIQCHLQSPNIHDLLSRFTKSVHRSAYSRFACKRIHYFSENSTRARTLIQLLSQANAPAHRLVPPTKAMSTPAPQAASIPREPTTANDISVQLYDIPGDALATGPGEPICTSIASGNWQARAKIQRATALRAAHTTLPAGLES